MAGDIANQRWLRQSWIVENDAAAKGLEIKIYSAQAKSLLNGRMLMLSCINTEEPAAASARLKERRISGNAASGLKNTVKLGQDAAGSQYGSSTSKRSHQRHHHQKGVHLRRRIPSEPSPA